MSFLKKKATFVYMSRKYKMALFSLLLVFCGFALAPTSPILATLFADFTYAIIALYAAYCGGNVSNKFVLRKQQLVDLKKEDPLAGVPGS